MEGSYGSGKGRSVQVSNLIFTTNNLCMMTSTILRMGKLNPKTFLSLGTQLQVEQLECYPRCVSLKPLVHFYCPFGKEAMLKGTWANGV